MTNLEIKSFSNIRHLSIRKKTASRICSTQVLYESSFLVNDIEIIIKSYNIIIKSANVDKGGRGKALIHKMWITVFFFFVNPSLNHGGTLSEVGS